jgi:Uma2 family endonuclease
METLLEERLYTYADLLELDVEEGDYYELINGELVKRSGPLLAHQTAQFNLTLQLGTYVTQRGLGIMLQAPFDIRFDDNNVVQPDLFFVLSARSAIITSICVEGAPDLIVEIISPSSVLRDRRDKFRLYEKFGVREYWLVEPASHVVEVYRLVDGVYDLVQAGTDGDFITSEVLTGFALDVQSVF